MTSAGPIRQRLDGALAADWRRAFIIQLAIVFLQVTGQHATRPTVTYRALELGASTLEIGLVQSAFSLIPTLAAVAVGRWVDRKGERAYIAIAMAILTIGNLMATYTDGLLLLGISQLISGMGQILFLVTSQALVANYGPRESREVRYGHYATVNSFGQLAGPALAALVIGSGLGLTGGGLVPPTTPTLAFLANALLTGTAAAIALLLPRPRRDGDGATSGSGQPGTLRMARQVLRRQGMAPAMTVSIVVASAVDVVIAYLPVYGEAVGLSVGLVGLLLSIRGIAGLVARIFMAQLIRLLTRERTLALSMLVAGLGLIALPFVTAQWLLVVLMVFIGAGLGLGAPMTIAWVANRSPRSERATALGVRITGNRGALLVVPSLMGAVAGAAGIMAIFLLLAGALLGGAALASVTPFDALAGGREETSGGGRQNADGGGVDGEGHTGA